LSILALKEGSFQGIFSPSDHGSGEGGRLTKSNRFIAVFPGGIEFEYPW